MIVFISGPIAGVADYKERFQTAADLLIAQGHTVVNPANMDSVVDGELTYKKILEMDKKLLECCDAICMLPGWEKSRGAKLERSRALELGMRTMEVTGYQ